MYPSTPPHCGVDGYYMVGLFSLHLCASEKFSKKITDYPQVDLQIFSYMPV